jgi:dTDP-4-dehydrorhamnose 3,5-epimerase-like enzyme
LVRYIENVKVIDGGLAVDDRGSLSFVNAFDFDKVKRFYKVENFSTSVIRAWHGHMKEGKYVYCVKGSAILGAVAMDSTTAPSKSAKVQRFVLSDRKPSIVFIPPGHANGFRCLEDGTQIIFFSTATLEETKGDDYRFPADYWGAEVWQVENR